jgi:hypothetical protein
METKDDLANGCLRIWSRQIGDESRSFAKDWQADYQPEQLNPWSRIVDGESAAYDQHNQVACQ